MQKPYLFLLFLMPVIAFCLPDSNEEQRQKSVGLFLEATKVFRHPRCLNCHPGGDRPTQGDDMHQHIMNVQRGIDDHGAVAMKCQTCHGTSNYAPSNVPGAPKWALAPRSLAWQGLTDHELCVLFKDTKRTHMSMEKFIAHNAEDPLVGWGWNPGRDRAPVPGTQKEFGRLVAEWVATGAACPN
ncbi:MAG: Isoquinoline 1-oxidoreductase subunit [Bacteriovoracia bacterium]